MSRRSYPHEATASEVLGLVVGGGALLAVLSAQVIFVAWIL
jgi:hypothetical protein